MSFTDGDVIKASHDDKRVLQIKKAFEVFTDMIRTQFEPLAQILTRKSRLKVVPHPSSSFTDGKRIALRVPLELGRDTEHTKHLCGVRDEDGAMFCPACYVLDDATATVAHEISHIVYDSFTEIDAKTIEMIFEKLLRPRIEAVDPSKVAAVKPGIMASKTAMEVAGKCDAWLPMVTNALEDVFVNESMYASRPGFRDPIRGTTIRTIMKGFLKIDGTRTEWKDSPKDARAIMVAYAIAADIEKVIPSLGDDLADLIADEKLRETVTKIHSKVTAQGRLELALQTLEILRGHGLCIDNSSIVFVKSGVPMPASADADGEAGESDDGEAGESSGDIPGADDDPLAEKVKGKGSASTSTDDDEEEDDESTDEDDDRAGSASTKDVEADEEDSTTGGEGEDDDTDSSDAEDDAKDAPAGKDDEADEFDDWDDEADSDAADSGEGADDADDKDDDGDDEVKAGKDSSADHDFDDDYDHDGSESDHSEEMPDMRDEDGDDDDAYKGGADSGMGSEKDVVDLVDMDDVEKALKAFMGHGDKDDEEPEFEEQVDRALAGIILDQADLFDDPSFNVRSVRRTDYQAVPVEQMDDERAKAPTDGQINPVLNELRIAFTKNHKVGMAHNLKSGPKLDGAHLYRVALDDPRLFARRSIPKKHSWSVVIGLDMSGSTGSGVSSVIKNGGYAMAELLTRLGIPFAMFGHSGGASRSGGGKLALDVFHVKEFDEPWNGQAKDRCLALSAAQANLDGHTLEFYRRTVEGRRETDKLIIYFTDGQMPAENYEEELRLLQRNIVKCKRANIRLLGVGVGTDSPKGHGLDTVRYDNIRDLPNLIKELGKRLA